MNSMIVRLYSDRLKDAAKAGQEDVYQYENLPSKLRVQVRRVSAKALGDASIYELGDTKPNEAAGFIRETLCDAKGRDNLGGDRQDPLADLLYYIEHGDAEGFLDAIDVGATVLDHYIRQNQTEQRDRWGATLDASDAIDEINFRFRDAGVGFQIAAGKIVRVDSQYAHAEMIKPALSLLNVKGFEGPQSEFLTAHEHYTAGRHKEAVTEAAKAFESLMKAVCDQKGWAYNKGARASDLLKVLRPHKLWPEYLDPSFDQLLATLTSGLPKVRNDTSAHGQGAVPTTAPSYVASYALHLAAAKMILIAEAAAG